ncbi:hypothetical protein PENTCL1PPCAC_26549, partial [Pristionchus entomophagus]
GVAHNGESSSTHPDPSLDTSPTVSTLEWTLPSKTSISISVVNTLYELIPSFVTPKHRSDPPNYLGILVTLVSGIDKLSWDAKIGVFHAGEQSRTLTKRFNEKITSEIRLDSFIEGLGGIVHIHVELLPLDDSLPSLIDITSRALIVQGDRFDVSAEALALNSPYFESLFFGPFNEKTKNEIEIDGVSSEEFKRLLNTLTKGQAIEEDTVVELLINSDRFDVPFVKDRCEDYLIEHEKTHGGSKTSASALSTLLIFSQKFRLNRFAEYLISRMESITQVVKCMELFSSDLPIPSHLMTSFGARIRMVPVRLRPEIYLDLSDTTDTWTERVTFELFSDLCPTIVSRFIDYCQGKLYENGRRRHLRGTHVSIIDVDAIEFFPVEHNNENPAYIAIPPDCEEKNDLLPSEGCLIASRESLVPQVDYPVTFGVCLGNPFHFGRSPKDVVVFGKLLDNREALEYLFYHSREKTFMIGESQLSQ